MSKLYSKIIKAFIFPVADRAMKTHIVKYYDHIIKMQKWSKQEIVNWQNKKLRNLINHAYYNTQYYNNLFNKLSIVPDNIREIGDLKKLPVLTKNDVIKNYNQLIPKNIEIIPHIKSSTGGSTGDPLRFLLDKTSWSFSNANSIINWEKTSYNYGDKHIALGSTSLFVNKSKSIKHYLYYKLKNKIGLNGINMSDSICRKYIDFIKKERINYLYGYASAIYLLAKHVTENNLKINISACFPTSEILTDSYRDAINKAFNCQIINCYGAKDGGVTAFEHEKGYFNVSYNSLITIKAKNKDNTGSALLTDLLNYAMPLINYQLGDELQIDEATNKIHPYNGQVINNIFGRTSDIVQFENGAVLTGPGFTILFKDLPVEAYRIEKNGFNSLLCTIKKHEKYNKQHEEIIISSLKKQAGKDSNISMHYVESFELTRSGKKNYFISK